jgi:hypothetical protein
LPAFLRGLRDSREGAGEPEGEGVRVGGWARGPAWDGTGARIAHAGVRGRASTRTQHRIA